MGGVFIYKTVLKLWCAVIVISAFVIGAVGADLQCTDSQIKVLFQSNKPDEQIMPTFDVWDNVENMITQFSEIFKIIP